jgi:hypothetical protein
MMMKGIMWPLAIQQPTPERGEEQIQKSNRGQERPAPDRKDEPVFRID